MAAIRELIPQCGSASLATSASFSRWFLNTRNPDHVNSEGLAARVRLGSGCIKTKSTTSRFVKGRFRIPLTFPGCGRAPSDAKGTTPRGWATLGPTPFAICDGCPAFFVSSFAGGVAFRWKWSSVLGKKGRLDSCPLTARERVGPPTPRSPSGRRIGPRPLISMAVGVT